MELASTTPILPRGVDRDDFTFIFLHNHAVNNYVGDVCGLLSLCIFYFHIVYIYRSLFYFILSLFFFIYFFFSKFLSFFKVLLTAHHAMILGNCPNCCVNSFQCIYLFIVLYMFRACHAHHQEKHIVSIQLLIIVTPCWWQCRVQPAKDTATNTE